MGNENNVYAIEYRRVYRSRKALTRAGNIRPKYRGILIHLEQLAFRETGYEYIIY